MVLVKALDENSDKACIASYWYDLDSKLRVYDQCRRGEDDLHGYHIVGEHMW